MYFIAKLAKRENKIHPLSDADTQFKECKQ